LDLSEDQLVAALTRLLSEDEPGLVVGPGDDAAVVEPGTGDVILTTDLLVEGVHFTGAAISARDLGAKAIVVNVSDVAAMGGSPRFALSSVALTPEVEAAWVVEMTGGMRDACREYGLALVGGDTNRGDLVVVSVAVVGEVAPGRAVRRSGARPGDALVVTGDLGAAAGGLALSRASHAVSAAALSEPWGRELADALDRPVARVGEGQTLAQAGASAMMDLSDGLAKDLSRLCESSGVGARVELDAVPIAEALRAASTTLGVDPLELALGGGEDYELLAAIDPAAVERATVELSDRFGVTLTRVGSIIEGRGVVAVGVDGREAPLRPKGWDHFS
jgi:thiamine-monophosphate kinase